MSERRAYMMHQFWSVDPWVVYQNTDRLGNLALLPPQPCVRIIRHSRAARPVDIFNVVKYCQQSRPDDVVLYAAQCDEHYAMRKLGVPVVSWNHNALLDENQFTITVDRRDGYLAIARVVSFKRLELCRELARLRVAGTIEDQDYWQYLRRVMPQAEFLNAAGYHFSEPEMARLINQSLATLVTSDPAKEGNCRAVTESLLCGIPVIATIPQPMCQPWLRAETCVFAYPSAGAVQRAAKQSRSWDRERIRALTLRRVHDYRSSLIDAVQTAAKRLGYPGFSLDVSAMVVAGCAAWQDRDRWSATVPEPIRSQMRIE